MELSKGWNSLDTVIAAERLALTFESVGRLKEVLELLERCLTARKTLLSEDHIQIAANLFHIARVEMQNSNQLKETCNPEAIAELEKAKNHLGNAIRIAQQVLDKLMKEGKKKLRETTRNCHEALMILMSSLDSLGMLEITKMELLGSWKDPTPVLNAKNALHKCVSAFNEFGPEKSSRNYGEAEFKYRSCSKRLSALLRVMDSTQPLTRSTLQELKNEMTEVKITLPTE